MLHTLKFDPITTAAQTLATAEGLRNMASGGMRVGSKETKPDLALYVHPARYARHGLGKLGCVKTAIMRTPNLPAGDLKETSELAAQTAAAQHHTRGKCQGQCQQEARPTTVHLPRLPCACAQWLLVL